MKGSGREEVSASRRDAQLIASIDVNPVDAPPAQQSQDLNAEILQYSDCLSFLATLELPGVTVPISWACGAYTENKLSCYFLPNAAVLWASCGQSMQHKTGLTGHCADCSWLVSHAQQHHCILSFVAHQPSSDWRWKNSDCPSAANVGQPPFFATTRRCEPSWALIMTMSDSPVLPLPVAAASHLPSGDSAGE